MRRVAGFGHVRVLWFLLAQGMAPCKDGDILPRAGTTAVHRAAEEGCFNALRVLLAHGGCVDRRDTAGSTPLKLAADAGFFDCVKLLYHNGASLAVLSESAPGEEPEVMSRVAASGAVDTLWCLIQGGVTICKVGDELPASGTTAVHRAAAAGCMQTLCLLIESGARFDLPDEDGNTPLMLAARSWSLECFRLLCENGAPLSVAPTRSQPRR